MVTQKPRRSKRKDTEVPQPSGPTTNVADEAVNEEMDDSLVMATTTASSLEAEQDSEQVVAAKDVNLSVDEVTLAQALVALKSEKVQEKGDVIKEPSVPVVIVLLNKELDSKNARTKAESCLNVEKDILFVTLREKKNYLLVNEQKKEGNKPPTQAQQENNKMFDRDFYKGNTFVISDRLGGRTYDDLRVMLSVCVTADSTNVSVVINFNDKYDSVSADS
ncbi:hypothetical protein Tco_1466967 [Tanacetum coccineum]